MMAFQSNAGDPVAGVVVILVFIVLGVLSLAFYFLPTIIAAFSKHRQAGAIFVLNLLAGWTFIGWVAALVWAFVQSNPQQVLYVQQPPQQYPPQPSGQYNAPPPDYNYRKFNQ